jgi:DNA polymerase-3 subunit gamma/tau
MDRQVLFDVSQSVFDRDAVKVIEIIDRLYASGHHMMRCFVEILDHFRNLLMVKMGGGQTVLSDVPDHEMDAMRQQVQCVPVTFLHQILDMLFQEEKNMKLAADPKLTLEMAFIRLLQIEPALSLDELIEKIDELQKGIANALSISHPTSVAVNLDGMKDFGDNKDASTAGCGSHFPVVSSVSEICEVKEDAAASKAFPDPSDLKNDNIIKTPGDTAKKHESLESIWKKILLSLSQEHPSLAACFAQSKIKDDLPSQIIVEFSANQFNINYAQRDDNRLLLSRLWSEQLGGEIQLTLIPEPISGNDAKKKEKKILQENALNNPWVARALKIFNGKIVEIKIL